MLLANFNGKEHLRHRAVSLRQHGFLVKRDVYVYRLHCAALVAGPQSVKPSRIIAGQEPEKTNEFLQTIARAVHRKVLSFYMQ